MTPPPKICAPAVPGRPASNPIVKTNERMVLIVTPALSGILMSILSVTCDGIHFVKNSRQPTR